ncbi:pyridine nucleotide-disulfide oxidoreductase domain-containing protein 1-like isoform X3 [Mytilus trossulus]|uniref:pyridine nucleotide-disulfide oxidoreductase domain-containing protein 1-like isoform X2 n=1 Tax=Mytilus trossulus TaxID=6551 RepID=UPI003004CC1F
MDIKIKFYKFIVVGGGIAGVSCAEKLSSLCPEDEILLISASTLVKTITNYRKITKALESFDVEERPMLSVETGCPNVKVVHKYVSLLEADKHILHTADETKYQYGKLCICSGGKPKLIAKDHPHVLGIRDTQSVKEFQKQLSTARRIIVVGNGGIATELVYEVEGCEVIWAIKHKSISSTFVDPGAAQFFLSSLNKDKSKEEAPSKRLKYTLEDDKSLASSTTKLGGALGPDWSAHLHMTGSMQTSHQVHVEYLVEIQRLLSPEELESAGLSESHVPESFICDKSWPVYVQLTNDKVYGCDFIVSATGVTPNTDPFLTGNQFSIAEDGGFKVNDHMQTTVQDVYAAGDICTVSWELSQHWFQMKLWSQARQMGVYSAMCMVADGQKEDIQLDFCFELFAHCTNFFNYKVILLGRFNAQGLGNDYELLLRVTKDLEYIKVVLQNGRLQGAILIGETDLEETFENLILNQIDLTPFKEHLLEPNIDLEDFFD